jgi:DNA-binding CsgD family transcriptional regulator
VRGRSAAGYELLHAAAGHAEQGEEPWCAAQLWLGELAVGTSDDTGLRHFTAARDALAPRGPSAMPAQALNGRAACQVHLDRLPEAADDARLAPAMSQRLGDPAGQALALYWLAGLAYYTGDHPDTLALRRQARQIDPAAIPVRTARRCSLGLTIALTEVGDYDSAQRNCAQALDTARQAGDLLSQAESLAHLADIDLRTGRVAEAGTRLGEAIGLAFRTGHYLMLGDLLDYCGHLCAAGRRWADAVTIWAAYAAVSEERGSPDPLPDAQRREEPLREARRALGPGGMQAAGERGRGMSLTTAAEFAALQITAGRQEPDTPPGLPRLSVREQELVTLVAQGHTDAQIADLLYISIRTVRSHLDRIRDKTGSRRRADLTRLALQAGLV